MTRRVLCVEDEEVLRCDLVETLAQAGFEAEAASNGADAISKLAQFQPDLIFCDVAMPQMGGYELLVAIRTRMPELAKVPIVLLTAFDETDLQFRTSHRPERCLTKPVDYAEVLRIADVLTSSTGAANGHDRGH